MLKKVLTFIKRIKIRFSVFIGKPEGSDEINKDFENDFDEEVSERK